MNVDFSKALQTWQTNKQTISLFEGTNNTFIARVYTPFSYLEIKPEQIRCGIQGITPHVEVIEKIKTFAKEKFAVEKKNCYLYIFRRWQINRTVDF